MNSHYPTRSVERDDWILARRPPRQALDPSRPYLCLLEEERTHSGRVEQVAAVFLTNRECPWRCLMCDLWKNTLEEAVPLGAIPAQLDYALGQWRDKLGPDVALANRFHQIKLYNSGSFFDPRAIPPGDYGNIARRLRSFARVIVECHPAFVDDRVLRFRDQLRRGGGPSLEVAMGLETAHPEVLRKLNKRMTLKQFEQAAVYLKEHDIALRVFVLVQPPFMPVAESIHWTEQSLNYAFDMGATVVSLIPTRAGNGAMEELAAEGHFVPPRLAVLETVSAYGVGLKRGRVFMDLWDLALFSECEHCFPRRAERLRIMNLEQTVQPEVTCSQCVHGGR